jgi:hypothetical protein
VGASKNGNGTELICPKDVSLVYKNLVLQSMFQNQQHVRGEAQLHVFMFTGSSGLYIL